MPPDAVLVQAAHEIEVLPPDINLGFGAPVLQPQDIQRKLSNIECLDEIESDIFARNPQSRENTPREEEKMTERNLELGANLEEDNPIVGAPLKKLKLKRDPGK